MSYTLELTIAGLPKPINRTLRKHWTVQVVEARKWKRAIWALVASRRPERPLKRAKLTLIRKSSACPDSDGLVSSFKHVIDGLIEARVIENDRYENIGMPSYQWEPAPRGKGSVQVRVEEIGSFESPDSVTTGGI